MSNLSKQDHTKAPLIILDRDGVINHDSDDYIKSVAQWQPIAGSIDAIVALQKQQFTLAVATNQSGIGRGYYSVTTLNKMHDKLNHLVQQAGGSPLQIFYCPHLPSECCQCRKPNIGLLEQIETALGYHHLNGVPFIGDSLKDLQAAQAKLCTPILVRTGKGQHTESIIKNDPDYKNIQVFDCLADVATHILSST